MKKLSLLVAFTLLSIGLVYGQSLDINYITFHGSDGVTDDVFSAGETVTVRARYDAVSLQSITGVFRASDYSGTSEIYVLWYTGTPDSSPDGSNIVSISNFNYNGLSEDGYAEFDITLPTPAAGATTFQLAFGIYGESSDWRATAYSDRNTSYATVGTMTVCPGDDSDGSGTISPEWEVYGNLDSTTETPTLIDPEDGASDNASMYIAFNLPEDATNSTVKLYVDDDSNHTNGYYNVLTLLNDYTTSGNHSMYINGGDLDDDPQAGDATDDVMSVSTPGNNSLTNGSTYYLAIGYQDETGNAEAKSAWAEFTYDTSVTNVSSVIATDLDLDEVQLSYYLPECSQDWKVTFCFDTDTNYSNGYTSEIVLADETNVGSPGTRTVLFNGNELSTTDYYISHSGAEAGSLTSGTQYYVGVQYTDCAGNTSSITYSGVFTYVYDTQTEEATSVSIDEEANASEGPVLDVSYTLPEDGGANSVYLLIDDDEIHGTSGQETATDVLYLIRISGNYLTGSHNFNLSIPFVTLDGGGDGDQVLSITTNELAPYGLNDSQTYYSAIRYYDSTGNPAVTTTPWVSFTWDDVSEAPTWSGSQPTADNRAFTFAYTLPEDGETNSVRIQIDNDATHTTIWTTLNILANDDLGDNSFVVDANQLNDATAYDDGTDDVTNTPTQSALPQGSNYYYRIGYQDQYGNAYAYSDWMQILYDSITQTPTLDYPAASTTFTTNFTLQYDLPENAYEGSLYVMFTRTSGTADSNSPHKLEIVSETAGNNIQITGLDPDNLTSSAAIANTPISGTGTLVDGAIYTITIGYQDIYQNTEATDSHTSCEYSSGAAVLEVSNEVLDLLPLAGPSNTNQLIFGFNLNTTSGSADFSAVTFSRSGTAASGEITASSFKLWLDDGDDVFEPAQDDDMSTGTGYNDWTTGTYSSIAMTGTAVSIDASGETFWVTIDETASAVKNHSIKLGLSSAASVISDADNTIGTFPINGKEHEMDGYVIISVDTSFSGGQLYHGSNRAIHKFSMRTNQGTAYISQAIIDFTGSGAAAGNFEGSTPMKLWMSTDETFNSSSDSVVGGPLAYNSALTFNWSARALLSVDATEEWYFVTGDIAETAEGTIQGSMDQDAVTSDYGIETDADGNETWTDAGGTSTLPVELSVFSVTNSGHTNILSWTTETETDNLGFNVYRGLSLDDISSGDAIQINHSLITGAGTTSEPTNYSYTDEYSVEYNVTYWYWLESVELGGITVLFSPRSYTPAEGGGSETPDIEFYGLGNNYPNPFNPSTTITFCLKKSEYATLDIYNVRGQLVKNLFNGTVSADDEKTVNWDGRDESGKETGSGIYYYRLKHGSTSEMKKMILLR